METGLKITEEQVQAKVPITVFHLDGWLDAQSEEQLLGAARDAYEAGSRNLVLDLSEVDTLTSAGMRAIQKVYRLYSPSSEPSNMAPVKMCNAPPQIYHVLGITGFLQTIPNYESTQAALDSFE
jgi:anti-anti-sigma factor